MQGQLFSQDFLLRGIQETPPWQALADAEFNAFKAALRGIFAPFGVNSTINEAQTEQLIIERVLRELGWADDYLPQVNLSGKRREDVPDILLFPDSNAKARAIAESKDDRRYRHGLAIHWQDARSRAEEFFEIATWPLFSALQAFNKSSTASSRRTACGCFSCSSTAPRS